MVISVENPTLSSPLLLSSSSEEAGTEYGLETIYNSLKDYAD
jgi:hypothetical protein